MREAAETDWRGFFVNATRDATDDETAEAVDKWWTTGARVVGHISTTAAQTNVLGAFPNAARALAASGEYGTTDAHTAQMARATEMHGRAKQNKNAAKAHWRAHDESVGHAHDPEPFNPEVLFKDKDAPFLKRPDFDYAPNTAARAKEAFSGTPFSREPPDAGPSTAVAPMPFSSAYDAHFHPAALGMKRRTILQSSMSGKFTCKIVMAWYEVVRDAMGDVINYYGKTFIDIKLCLFMQEFAFFGTQTDCDVAKLKEYQRLGANFTYWEYVGDAYDGIVSNIPSVPSLGGNSTAVAEASSKATSDSNGVFMQLFQSVFGVRLKDMVSPRAADAVSNATFSALNKASSLMTCNYNKLYGNEYPDPNAPNVHQLVRLGTMYFGWIGVVSAGAAISMGPASGMLTGAIGTFVGFALPFFAYHSMYGYDFGCLFGYPPALNGRLADDLYNYLDWEVLPDCVPPIMDNYIALQRGYDVVAREGKCPAPTGYSATVPQQKFYSCTDAPYGFTDGMHVLFFFIESERPTWRAEIKGVPFAGKYLWMALDALPTVSDAINYYNKTAIVADQARYDACVKFLWPVHMTSMILQVVLVAVAAMSAVVFLVVIFNTLLILSIGLDRLIRKVMFVSYTELLDESDGAPEDAD